MSNRRTDSYTEWLKQRVSDQGRSFWGSGLQMLFSTDKSKIIHFGFNNNESSYVLGTSTFCTVNEERDLG